MSDAFPRIPTRRRPHFRDEHPPYVIGAWRHDLPDDDAYAALRAQLLHKLKSAMGTQQQLERRAEFIAGVIANAREVPPPQTERFRRVQRAIEKNQRTIERVADALARLEQTEAP